jgi:hypothetical protein
MNSDVLFQVLLEFTLSVHVQLSLIRSLSLELPLCIKTGMISSETASFENRRFRNQITHFWLIAE